MEFEAPDKEYLFSEILDKINEGIVATDDKLNVIYVNPFALKMTGRDEAIVLGKPVQIAFPLIKSDDFNPLIPSALPEGDEPSYFADVVLHNLQHGQVIVGGCVIRIGTKARDGKGGGFVLLLRDISEAKQLSALINFRDNYDPLTGLYKSAVFMTRLKETLDNIRCVNLPQALLYIDIDFFQSVSNTGGVEASTALLQAAAEVIRGNVDRQDFAGHLAKDDFAVILRNCPHENANGVAKRLLEAFGKHTFVHNGKQWPITISIGVYTLTQKDTVAETALDKARTACWEAYKKGGNRIAFVSPMSRYGKSGK